MIYDVDNTFGIDWFNKDWMHRNPYQWSMSGNESRPLYTRIMSNTVLRKQYTYTSQQLINQIDLDSLCLSLEARQVMLAPYVSTDPYYPLDYGYSYNDFQRSLTEVIGDHVKTSIFGFFWTHDSVVSKANSKTPQQRHWLIISGTSALKMISFLLEPGLRPSFHLN